MECTIVTQSNDLDQVLEFVLWAKFDSNQLVNFVQMRIARVRAVVQFLRVQGNRLHEPPD